MKCPYCDATIKKAKFCPECGKELESGLTEKQRKYLKSKKTAHTVASVGGGIFSGLSLTMAIVIIIIGVFLTMTGILAIIGIPMIIYGVIGLLLGGGLAAGASHSSKKAEEIDDELHGIKKK